MKIVITSTGDSIESNLDIRFGMRIGVWIIKPVLKQSILSNRKVLKKRSPEYSV